MHEEPLEEAHETIALYGSGGFGVEQHELAFDAANSRRGDQGIEEDAKDLRL
jgi:hypothetical protein